MLEHKLHYSLQLPQPRTEVFSFFADAANLEQLTPPELNFVMLSPLPVAMKQSAEIEYRLKLFGITIDWKSVISEWAPPDLFVEEMVQGPYQCWRHLHRFSDGAAGSTIIDDELLFKLPAAPLGELAYPLVKVQLERIFDYRQERLRAILLREGHL